MVVCKAGFLSARLRLAGFWPLEFIWPNLLWAICLRAEGVPWAGNISSAPWRVGPLYWTTNLNCLKNMKHWQYDILPLSFSYATDLPRHAPAMQYHAVAQFVSLVVLVNQSVCVTRSCLYRTSTWELLTFPWTLVMMWTCWMDISAPLILPHPPMTPSGKTPSPERGWLTSLSI